MNSSFLKHATPYTQQVILSTMEGRKLPTLKGLKGERLSDDTTTRRNRPSPAGPADELDESPAPSEQKSRPKIGEKESDRHARAMKSGIRLVGRLSEDLSGQAVEMMLSGPKKKEVFEEGDEMFYPTSGKVFNKEGLTVKQTLFAAALYGQILVCDGAIVVDDSPIDRSKCGRMEVYNNVEDVNPGDTQMLWKVAWFLYTFVLNDLSKTNKDILIKFMCQVINSSEDDGVFVTPELRDELNGRDYIDQRLNDTVVFYRLIGMMEDVYADATNVIISGFARHKLAVFSALVAEADKAVHVRNYITFIVLFSTVVIYNGDVYECDTKRGNTWSKTEFNNIGSYVAGNPNKMISRVRALYLPAENIMNIVGVFTEGVADDTISTMRVDSMLKSRYPPFNTREDTIPAQNGILETNKAAKTVTVRPIRPSDMVMDDGRAPFHIQSHRLGGRSVPMAGRMCQVVIDGTEQMISGNDLFEMWSKQMFTPYDAAYEYECKEKEDIAKDAEYRLQTFLCMVIHILSGELAPKKLIAWLGREGNEGKSFLDLIVGAIVPRKLVHEATVDVFTTTSKSISQTGQHSDHLAQCSDRRIIKSGEVAAEDKGAGSRVWDESNVKKLSSGGVDPIAARGVRQRGIRFTHKGIVFVIGNKLPGIPQEADKAMLERLFVVGLYSRFHGCRRPDYVNWIYPQMEMSENVITLLASMIVEKAITFLETTELTPNQLRYFCVRPSTVATSVTGDDLNPVVTRTEEYVPCFTSEWETRRYYREKLTWVQVLILFTKRRYADILNDRSSGLKYDVGTDTPEEINEDAPIAANSIAEIQHQFVCHVNLKQAEANQDIVLIRRYLNQVFSKHIDLWVIGATIMKLLQVAGIWCRRKTNRSVDEITFLVEPGHPWWSCL